MQMMKVGIAGAGSIAFAMAAFLERQGHAASLWSPSGERTKALAGGEPLVAKGAIDGTFRPAVAATVEELAADADAIVIALPAYGHKQVFDRIAPHITAAQTVIVSSHASFGALYLSRLLAARGVVASIVGWGTTLLSGRQRSPTEVQVNTVRKTIDLATVPATRAAEGLATCRALFGDRFVDRQSLLAIALSNLNPQNHMGIALANMTRMERGETWGQGQNVTPNVGRLLEELDRERIAIATALGLEVRTIFQHFHLSFHVPVGSISQMNQEMRRRQRRRRPGHRRQPLCHRGRALRPRHDRENRPPRGLPGPAARGRRPDLLGDVWARLHGRERSFGRARHRFPVLGATSEVVPRRLRRLAAPRGFTT
jgi:opine dehydrogenase